MKCKPYSKITVEIRTQLKTVKITSNIFAVYMNLIETGMIEIGKLFYFCVKDILLTTTAWVSGFQVFNRNPLFWFRFIVFGRIP